MRHSTLTEPPKERHCKLLRIGRSDRDEPPSRSPGRQWGRCQTPSPRCQTLSRSRQKKSLRGTSEAFQVKIYSGGDLLSHVVANAVPSALRGLTAVFGMGTGMTPSLIPPEKPESQKMEN